MRTPHFNNYSAMRSDTCHSSKRLAGIQRRKDLQAYSGAFFMMTTRGSFGLFWWSFTTSCQRPCSQPCMACAMPVLRVLQRKAGSCAASEETRTVRAQHSGPKSELAEELHPKWTSQLSRWGATTERNQKGSDFLNILSREAGCSKLSELYLELQVLHLSNRTYALCSFPSASHCTLYSASVPMQTSQPRWDPRSAASSSLARPHCRPLAANERNSEEPFLTWFNRQTRNPMFARCIDAYVCTCTYSWHLIAISVTQALRWAPVRSSSAAAVWRRSAWNRSWRTVLGGFCGACGFSVDLSRRFTCRRDEVFPCILHEHFRCKVNCMSMGLKKHPSLPT